MKQKIKKYLNFNNRERRAIIFILSLILFVILLKHFNHFIPKNNPADFSAFEKEITEFENSLSKKKNETTETISIQKHFPVSNLFYFDPNSINNEQMRALGFNSYLIKTINKYREKGGRFYIKTDLKKIYGIDEETYLRIEPYISIKQEESIEKAYPEALIELNSLDSAKLPYIKGLDYKTIKRIIKYRDLLGGYIKKEQLKEVYGINEKEYLILDKNCTIDTTLIKPICINSANINVLKKHPYLSSFDAEAIVAYRTYKNYKISDFKEIKDNNLIQKESLIKIQPYLNYK